MIKFGNNNPQAGITPMANRIIPIELLQALGIAGVWNENGGIGWALPDR